MNVDFKYYSDPSSLNQVLVTYEQVPMILSDSGKVYSVTSLEGSCQIRQIDFASSNLDGIVVFEAKTDRCLGFKYSDGNFYFIKDDKVVEQLVPDEDGDALIQKS